MSAAGLVEVVVHSLTSDGDRVLLVDLRPVDTGAVGTDAKLPPFEAGAHLDLHLDSPSGSVVRQYSLIGPDDDTSRYLIAVLRERDGRGGSAAVHGLAVGTRLAVSPPRNSFRLDPGAGHSVLLAGGIGVTPVVAMAERLHRQGASFELHVYSATPQTLPLARHLEGRPWRDRVVLHYSSAGDGFRGNAQSVIPRHTPGRALYVCGPLGMIASATACASAREWPRSAVHTEQFARSQAVETAGEEFTVVVASTGRELAVGPEETIAAVLRRHGIETTLACEQGLCGSCLTPVLAGIPDHRDEVQSPAERETNTLINVCCSRSLSPSLTLGI
ncbi:PDR/VanB family oxidoreductase [Rhodococcus sp. IEGM 1408]|uniref:PDR/VanB family oxidoreductase n=1 Tax=Rhodococcus sp. IEGM 1408 TaxID=3082220 RepID=UPI0029530808|nr:PDR/VanB family oxidoreductase [Rhodococcus sp. IEGM 1408]MDV8001486.1 PDR/VanB family oxidoreductase [Rhodococcus sp. IEGM 1408]